MQRHRIATLLLAAIALPAAGAAGADATFAWRYLRPTNTGIQGDYNDAVWVAPDGNPYIGGYHPGFEEGGFARFVVAENRWENVSNVDYPIIGHPETVGTTRVVEFLPQVGNGSTGPVWIATWRGVLRFDPAVGPASLERIAPSPSGIHDAMVSDMDRAPDGTIWFVNEGVVRYDPSTGAWTRWNVGNQFLSIQPKSTGGYRIVSASQPPIQDTTFSFDSDTQQWTATNWVPQGPAGQLVGLPGKDASDDAGNLWAIRTNAPGAFNSLDYRRPNGTWATPPEPYASFAFDLWAFKAYGNGKALAADGSGTVYQFNGTSWINLGVWRPGQYTYALDIDAAGNVWASGIGGAGRRDARTGVWQRYRVTNTSNIDFFNNDLALDPHSDDVWVTSNAGAGVGGMCRYDGVRWECWNQETYGLGHEWPFLTDNSLAIAYRASKDRPVVAPSDWIYGVHEWTGTDFVALPPNDGAKKMVEDSLGRLWTVGSFLGLAYHDGVAWTSIPDSFYATVLKADPTLPGTVWALGDTMLIRTDGSDTRVWTLDDFPGSMPTFTGLAIDPSGIVWMGTWLQFTPNGSTLIRLDTIDDTYTTFQFDDGWPFPGQHVRPAAVTSDGRLWMTFDSEYDPKLGGFDAGLCWYDGTDVGVFQAPPAGQPQWGGLPHASIADLEVRPLADGYELWMSCMSRGLAVLRVTVGGGAPSPDLDGDGSVGAADLSILLGAWGACGDPCPADLDGDGAVGAADLAALLGAWS